MSELTDLEMAEKALLILQEAKKAGYRITEPNLRQQAARRWKRISTKSAERIAIIGLRLDRGEIVEGLSVSMAPAAANGSAPAPPAPERPKPTPARPAPAEDEPEPLTPDDIREFVTCWLEKNPGATPGEAWAAVNEYGRVAIMESSFTTRYFYPLRRDLRSRQDEDSEQPRDEDGPDPAAQEPLPPTAAPEAAAEPAKKWPNTVAGVTAELERRYLVDRAAHAGPIPTPRSRYIELGSDEGDHFEATLREDGQWEVRLSLVADSEVMGQLAAHVWPKVVGGEMEEVSG